MNLYQQQKHQQQEVINEFLKQYAFFAFSDAQFKEGLQAMGITEQEAPAALVSFGAGGYIRREYANQLKEILAQPIRERAAALADPETGPQFAFDMFLYELNNHEYSWTGDTGEALEALGYSFDDVAADPVLSEALKKAEAAAR